MAFQTRIGEANAGVFDANGWLYFTREEFDLFYPGYGDTWPTFNGSVGMTYEQGGGGRAALAIETAAGDTLRLADRIAHHVSTGLTTVDATARNAAQVRAEFAAFFRRPLGAVRAYAAQGDAGRLAGLATLLDRQGIRYAYADREQSVRGTRYAGGQATATGRQTLRQGSLVVPLDQPKGTLAAVLFEPAPPLADSVTYDITAWALPYVFNVEGLEIEGSVTTAARAPAVAPALPERPVAYLARWQTTADAALLARLLRAGVRVRVAAEPFTQDGEAFDRGTLVIARAGNGDAFDRTVRDAAAAAGRPLFALRSGFVPSGRDLGSGSVGRIAPPRVVVAASTPVSPTALGEVWHLFEQTLGYPVTLVDADNLAGALDDADVLVLPDGRWGAWMTDARAERLLAFARGGGRIVAMEGAVAALAGRDGFGIGKERKADADTSDAALLRPYAEQARRDAAEGTPGSIFRVQVDPTHPLAFGLPDHTYTLKQSAGAVPFLADGWNVGVLRDGAPAAGFAGRATRARLAESLVFGVTDVGRGHVVAFVDDPLFRGFWADGQLVFANAVFTLGAE